MLTLLGALGYACAGLVVRYLAMDDEPFDVIGITAAQFLCGSVLLLPYLFLSGDVGASDWGSAELWLSIAFIAIGAQVLGYMTFNLALTRWAGVARVPLDVPRARDRDPHRGRARTPAGRRPDARHGDRRRRGRGRQPARRGAARSDRPQRCSGRSS